MSVSELERMQQEIAKIAQPLVTHYKELEHRIKTMERETAELRKARTQLRSTIRSIDPKLIATPTSSNGKKKDYNAQGNTQDQLAALGKWFQDNRDSIDAAGGVHASGLINAHGEFREDYDVDLIGIRNQSKLSAAMRILHEQGVLRLDHAGNGGAKYYKAV